VGLGARVPGLTASAPGALAAFDLRALPDSFYDDPYPTYRALRQTDPVHALPGGGVFLTRYEDVLAVYQDPARFSSDKKAEFTPKFGPSRLLRHHTTSLVFNDAPYHTRVRRLIMGALIPRALAPLEPRLVSLVDRLLDDAHRQGGLDAIDAFAAAIPVEVIGDLLAMPMADRAPLRAWSLAILGALEPAIDAGAFQRGEDALAGFLSYLEGLVAERRRRPGDRGRDVLTRLIEGEGGERLSEAELLENCIFLLNAGHETTSNLIGNGLELLARFPAERARLLGDPNLIRPAVEEILRFESSNQLGNRVTTTKAEIGGVALPAGTFVTLGVGAANRDPAAFEDPDRFDIARDPNRHLAFASGVHQCAGQNLARMEGRIALGRFAARFPGYRLAGPPIRNRRARFRGFAHLPIEIG
jgi:cytochrome P450